MPRLAWLASLSPFPEASRETCPAVRPRPPRLAVIFSRYLVFMSQGCVLGGSIALLLRLLNKDVRRKM